MRIIGLMAAGVLTIWVYPTWGIAAAFWAAVAAAVILVIITPASR